ncbi:hypothetical protein B0H19DRAFT_1367704 [Mycena capillaripes]|nr:hypothetical protein B0H19DRAFT_1367704 [Mycena capillaripes]
MLPIKATLIAVFTLAFTAHAQVCAQCPPIDNLDRPLAGNTPLNIVYIDSHRETSWNRLSATSHCELQMATLATERDRVVELDAEILRLQREREPLKARLDTYKYPVLTLPNEIVSELFVNVLPPYPLLAPTSGPQSPTALGQICRKWRAIALSTPALWSTIDVTLDYRKLKKEFSYLETWLERSRSHPLSISLKDGREEASVFQINCFLTTVYLHSAQLQHLVLSLPFGDSNLELLQQPMPLLSSLEIWTHRVDTEGPVSVFQNASRLRTLEILHFTPQLIFPWSQITSFTCQTIRYSDWAAIMHAAAALMHCKVAYMTTGSDLTAPRPIPALLSLESLIFSMYFPRSVANNSAVKGLLSTMTLPALRRLHIPEEYLGHQPVHKLAGFIERSGCALSELRVVDPRLSREIYLNTFSAIPKLEFVLEGERDEARVPHVEWGGDSDVGTDSDEDEDEYGEARDDSDEQLEEDEEGSDD